MPIACRISAPAPLENTSGSTPRMKANEVMRIGRSRMRQASSAASTGGPALHVELARELDDQDRVLAGQADQHEEADLREDVVVALGEPHAGDGAEQAHRHDQDDRERQRPALVLRRQHQEHEQHAEREDEDRRVAGQLLLVAEVGPLVADAVGQHLARDPLDRRLAPGPS